MRTSKIRSRDTHIVLEHSCLVPKIQVVVLISLVCSWRAGRL